MNAALRQAVAKAHRQLEYRTRAYLAGHHLRVSCSKGCFACCSAWVVVGLAEAEYLREALEVHQPGVLARVEAEGPKRLRRLAQQKKTARFSRSVFSGRQPLPTAHTGGCMLGTCRPPLGLPRGADQSFASLLCPWGGAWPAGMGEGCLPGPASALAWPRTLPEGALAAFRTRSAKTVGSRTAGARLYRDWRTGGPDVLAGAAGLPGGLAKRTGRNPEGVAQAAVAGWAVWVLGGLIERLEERSIRPGWRQSCVDRKKTG